MKMDRETLWILEESVEMTEASSWVFFQVLGVIEHFGAFLFWHPKNSSHKASMLFFPKPGENFNNTNQWRGLLLLFVWNFCSKEFHSRGPDKFLLCIFQHKGFPQQPLRSRLCGVQRPHFWSSDFNGLPGPAAKGGEDSGGTGHMKEIARVIELFSEPWLWTKS